MMADSIEHVISYWIIFQKFQSPALGGFAVLSHWLPFLFFSVYSGALADRLDPRRIIQLGMLLFMAASLGWGLLFLTGSLELWHAAALLVVHGFAGVLWAPAAQLLIHDIVGEKHLHSAIRLIATGRYLGLLLGPAVGGLILLAMGPARGILFNMLIYLPLILWLWKAPYGGRKPAAASRGLAELVPMIRAAAHSRVIVSMTLLAGGASLLVTAGFFELSFNAMAQTLVQVHAPSEVRGRVIGLFAMASLGLRAFSGVTVGLGGSLIGVHWSLAASAAALLLLTMALLALTWQRS